MQKFVLFVLAGLLVLNGTGCGSSAKDAKTTDQVNSGDSDRPVPPKEPPFPKAVVVGAPTHEFKAMEAGTVGKHSFVIKNEGDFPLELAKGPTTCKCTLNSLSKTSLKKGESTTVDLEWKPPGVSPDFTQTAEIWTNDPENPTIQFVVKGVVAQAAELRPEGTWPFGVIDGPRSPEFTGIIKSSILDKFEINGIHSPADDLSIKHRPLTKEELAANDAKCGYLITATLKPKNEIGPFSKRLTIKTTIHQDKDHEGESYVVDLTGTRTGPILIDSSDPDCSWDRESMQMVLKSFSSTDGKSVSLTLYVDGLKDEEQLQIQKTVADPEFIEVRLEALEATKVAGVKPMGKPVVRKKSYRLHFNFPAGSPPAVRTRSKPAKVTITTNHPGAKEMAFTIVFRSF